MVLGRASLVWAMGWLAACTSPTVVADVPATSGPETRVNLSWPAADKNRLAELTNELDSTHGLTADAMRAERARPQVSTLDYQPWSAAGIERIQASSLSLEDAERQRLSELGFLVSTTKFFPTMLYAYAALYAEDLPLYVSADSILDAIYRSYEAILQDIEQSVLTADVSALVAEMRSALAESTADSNVRADVDYYLTVTQSLLDGTLASPVAGADADDIASLVAQLQSAEGHDLRTLFGVERDIDLSQFKPRGHYTETPELEHYFQALTWLARGDLRLIETQSNGQQLFRLRQLQAAVLMRQLLHADGMARYRRIDATLAAFTGASDAMRLSEIDALLADLKVESPGALAQLDPEKIAQTIVDRGYGAQRIASQLLKNATPDRRDLPLDRSLAVLGQRYTVDSHVLSNVVYDVVPDRYMPDPLDAAYAAFGNDAALSLLGSDLDHYAPALESARQLVDAHDSEYWSESLYTSWLHALRSLSTPRHAAAAHSRGLPALTDTPAWNARILNTQLASWAQLRHATGLYAKQSYTAAVLCEYPDAYVEPYPEFFEALVDFATRGDALAEALRSQNDALADKLSAYFANLTTAMTTLGAMAELERAGKPHTAEQLAYVNQAVHHYAACPGPQLFDGWYAKLDYEIMPDGRVISEPDPVVADIHTQPTDASGRDVGRILHIGTGLPRLMVVTLDTCQGPKAFAGPVSSYSEVVTDNWLRLNDADWTKRVLGMDEQTPIQPSWARAFVVADPQ